MDEEAAKAEDPVSASVRRERPLTLWDAILGKTGQVIHEDKCVRLVVAEGWGMQELQLIAHGQVPIESFEKIKRKERYAQMQRYFEDEMQIIPSPRESPRIPDLPWLTPALNAVIASLFSIAIAALLLAGFLALRGESVLLVVMVVCATIGALAMFYFLKWLADRYRKDRIWPGLMEERLRDAILRKFPEADSQIRSVIDRYADVFLDNNWMLVRLKRFFQAGAIVLFYAVASPIALVAGAQLQGGHVGLAVLLGVSALPAAFAVTYPTFQFLNKYIYTNMYAQSLRVSAQQVENLILERMTSINILLHHTITHITQLMQQGERPERDPNRMDDGDLQEYDTFFGVQTLHWLAKRLEYIELHLHNTLHTLLTIEGVMDIAGRVMALAICITGLTPAALLIVDAGADIAQAQSVSYLAGAQLVLALAVSGFVLWVSYISYGNEKWNPMKLKAQTNLLEEHFELKFRAQTYEKQQLDVKLAARTQRAVFQIHSYFARIGISGGQAPMAPSPPRM